MSDSDLEPEQIVAERYRTLRLLGMGGMGAVWLVEHAHLRKRFALKVLRKEMCQNPEVVARFEREAMAAAHIGHPHVAEATDFGRLADGSFFLVLEFVEGMSLRDAGEAGPLPEARAVSIARQIASALGRAHELGIVHRDLKPENVVLIAQEGGGDFVKVLDFGIAKVNVDDLAGADAGGGQVLTQAGQIFGTPEYMAPEQAAGDTVDARADLYALGVMLFEMLAGRRPFESDDLVGLLGMHMAAPVPTFAEAAPGVAVSSAVEAIVRKLLEKKPEDRFASAHELEAALAAVLGETSPAPPSGVALPTRSPLAPPISTRSPAWSSADAVAKTRMPMVMPAKAGLLADPRVARALAFARERRAIVIGAAGGAALLLVLVVVVAASALGRHRVVVSVPGAPSATVESEVDEDDLAAAQAKGIPALEKMAQKHPRDPAVLRALVGAYAKGGRDDDALGSFATLLDADPSAAADPAMQKVVAAAAKGQGATADRAMDLLEGPMGAGGADVLYDLAEKGGKRSRFAKALDQPGVRKHASPALDALLDLRDAKGCKAKKAAVEKVTAAGDSRALPTLKHLEQRRGCGLFGTRDCWSCLRKGDVVESAIAAVDARSPSPAASAP